ncbi:MAG: hypothetical protein P8Y47_11615 [Alphaproteobacteria bacterium]
MYNKKRYNATTFPRVENAVFYIDSATITAKGRQDPQNLDIIAACGKRPIQISRKSIFIQMPKPQKLSVSHSITRLDLACDLIFKNDFDLIHAIYAFDQFAHHKRSRETTKFVGKPTDQTRYTKGRFSASNLVLYQTPYSRVTGQLNTLHIEMRIIGARNVKKLGVHTIEDIASLTESRIAEELRKKIKLATFNKSKLGRNLRRHFHMNLTKSNEEIGKTILGLFRTQDILQLLKAPAIGAEIEVQNNPLHFF